MLTLEVAKGKLVIKENKHMSMKKLVTVKEVEGEGLAALLGKQVIIFCMSYIYTGKLEGVNTQDILLQDAKIVYDTGAFSSKSFFTAEKLPFSHYIRTSSIESYAETDKT